MMAKLLLRKRPSDVTEIIEETRGAPKKLKLIGRENDIVAHLEALDTAVDDQTLLQMLQAVSGYFPLGLTDVDYLCRGLCDVAWSTKRSSHIRSVALDLLTALLQEPWLPVSANRSLIATRILEMTQLEVEDEVMVSICGVLEQLVPTVTADSANCALLSAWCRKSLKEASNSMVRASCLALLTAVIGHVKLEQINEKPDVLKSPPRLKLQRSLSASGSAAAERQSAGFLGQFLESLLAEYSQDCDTRVRMAALDCLMRSYESMKKLPQDLYLSVCKAFDDDCEKVRLLAIKLVRIFARLYPESTEMSSDLYFIDAGHRTDFVKTGKTVSGFNVGIQLRLVDDAFGRLCNAMHDLSVDVRAEAATLLGTLTNVSKRFLEQTLDKKLMSNMKWLKSMRGAGRGGPRGSEWSTGRKFGGDQPIEQPEDDSVSLIPSGACGAFITGLEDEYFVVRNASVSAVCNLASAHPTFSTQALDMLADMFNDEIKEVRLNAIQSLRRICQHVRLKEEQMEIILNVLEDYSSESRESLRDLLSSCQMSTQGCLSMTVKALLNNLRRYPSDKLSIWKCMKCVGRNHGGLTLSLAPVLLNLHSYFDMPEPAVEDPAYMATLILVLNAAAPCPPLKALFVDHTWRHYHYLRDSSPHLVATLDRTTNELDKGASYTESKEVLGVVTSVIHHLSPVSDLSSHHRIKLLTLLVSDLRKISNSISDERLQVVAEFLLNFLETELTMEKYLTKTAYGIRSPEREIVLLFDILKRSLSLEHLYACEDGSDQLWSLLSPHRMRILAALMVQVPQIWSTFLTNLEMLKSSKSLSSSPGGFIHEICKLTEDLSPDNFHSHVDNIISCCRRHTGIPESQTLPDLLQLDLVKKTARIVLPVTDTETVIKFTAGLVAAVEMEADLEHFSPEELRQIRVRICYPDQKEHLIRPRESDFRTISPGKVRLQTQSLLSHGVWTDSSVVEISLVRVIPENECFTTPNCGIKYVLCSNSVQIRVLPKTKC